MPDELRAAIVLFASLLDERQRRLFAGLEGPTRGGGRRVCHSTTGHRRRGTRTPGGPRRPLRR